MNVEELQAAINRWDDQKGYVWQAISNEAFEAISTGMEAARLVADPNIEAARESVDMPAVVLLLWRIMELVGVGVAEFPERDSTGFAMMIRDSIVNKELFAAALTPGDTDGDQAEEDEDIR